MTELQPVAKTTELPKPNMDIYEIESTLKFIAECKAEGVDCTALEEYIAPVLPKRVNLDEL